jgi:hypothetical protein
VSWAIIGVLAIVALGVYFKQFSYDPALFRINISERPSSAPSSFPFAPLPPSELKVLSPPESFGPQTLSDKINGKAELYLSADFLHLVSQRFVRADDPQAWVEIFVYDMGTHKNAFAVYSAQRRSEAESSDLTGLAYKTRNALFWVHGKYYVEAVASVSSETMLESLESFARRFIATTPAEKEVIGEIGLFPPRNLVEGSITLLSADVFGLQGFEKVYTGLYKMGAEEVTGFLSRRESPREARNLAETYHSFLLENGGVDVPLDNQVPGALLVNIMDTYEIIFYHGSFLAGVHQAESREAAETLALELHAKISEVAQ